MTSINVKDGHIAPLWRNIPVFGICHDMITIAFSSSIFISSSLNIVVHVHQIANCLHIICDIAVTVYSMLDDAASHCKVYHVHRLISLHHGVNQAAGKGVAATHTIQNVKGEQLALEGVSLVPHIGHQAVLTATVGVSDMAGDALQIRIPLHEMLEHLILLFVAGLKRNTVLPIPFAVILLAPPQMVRFNTKQYIHIGQALGTEVSGLLPWPQFRAEVAIKADGKFLFFCLLQTFQDELGAAGREGRGNAAEVKPVKAIQQRIQIHI